MQVLQILDPVLVQQILQAAPFVVMAAAVMFSACLFFALRRDFHQVLAGIKRDLKRLQAETGQLNRDFAEFGVRLQDAEERAGVLVPPPALRSGLNVTRRTQVIRMFRRGDRPEGIAQSLNLPRGEVELLLKVHRLAVDGKNHAKLSE